MKGIAVSALSFIMLWSFQTFPLSIGDPAPDFSLTTTDGSTVSLEQYRGRVLVLYFCCAM